MARNGSGPRSFHGEELPKRSPPGCTSAKTARLQVHWESEIGQNIRTSLAQTIAMSCASPFRKRA